LAAGKNLFLKPLSSSPSPPARRSTIRDVAKRAGVSVATVSRVLAGNYPAAPATRSKVMRAVRELDYVVNTHARALAGVTTKSVAIIVNSVLSHIYAQIAQGVETEAATEGRLCVIGTTGGDPERELALVRLMREQHADAVILVGNVVINEEYQTRIAHYARSLTTAGSRLVLCGRPPLGPEVPAIVVEYDNTGGAHMATSHLLSAGHERIAYLGRQPGNIAQTRIEGYRRALADHRVAHDPGLERDGAFGRHDGYRMMNELLATGRDFTAVFAATDVVASGARQALLERGLRIPEDVSLVGFDDAPQAADIGLTTVHLPGVELGRTAVRLALASQAEHNPDGGPGTHVILGTHVVVRDSVRPRLTR
jgi:LacI family transcriptional regulator